MTAFKVTLPRGIAAFIASLGAALSAEDRAGADIARPRNGRQRAIEGASQCPPEGLFPMRRPQPHCSPVSPLPQSGAARLAGEVEGEMP
jgi:hypothetical protein